MRLSEQVQNIPRPSGSEDAIRLERLRRRRRRYPFGRLLRANLRDIRLLGRQSGLSLLLLVTLLVASALYLSLAYFPQRCLLAAERCGTDGDFVAALYATMLLLVFETPTPFPQDLGGRLLFFGVPLLGLFFLLQSVVDFARLLFDKGARREGWQIALASTFSEHVLVCGIGPVGYRVVLQLLDAGYEVVVIDRNEVGEFTPIIHRLKVPLIVGDARDPDVLHNAGLGRARGLVAAIGDDLLNVEVALAARRRYPQLQTALRIFNRELDRQLELSFGHNSAFSSSALAAPTLAAAALSRGIVHVLRLPEALLALIELTLSPDSPLLGPLDQLEAHSGLRLLRLRDSAGREQSPLPTTCLTPGDTVLLLGPRAALEAARQANLTRAETPRAAQLDTLIICGLGKVGTAMVRLLLQLEPQASLVVICRELPAPRLAAELAAAGVRVVCGDAREPEVLAEAGLAQAYALAAVVGDDLTNLQVGLAVRTLRPELHLVLRVFSDVLAERLAALFGINSAYSTSALAAPTLAAAAVLPGVDHAFDLGPRLFASETLKLEAGMGLAGRQVAALRADDQLLVLALRRSGTSTLLPAPAQALAPGDEVVLLAELRHLARLREQAASKLNGRP